MGMGRHELAAVRPATVTEAVVEALEDGAITSRTADLVFQAQAIIQAVRMVDVEELRTLIGTFRRQEALGPILAPTAWMRQGTAAMAATAAAEALLAFREALDKAGA